MPKLSEALFTLAFFVSPAHADVLTIGAAQDNTLYESVTGDTSNGSGRYMFAGVTKMDEIRRGLVQFNVAAAIPAGSTITSVELRLRCSKASMFSGPKNVWLHRGLASWGEGASDGYGEEGVGDDAQPGDATWVHRFFPGDPWTNIGGDYAAAPSAVLAIASIGPKSWGPTGAMVSDVQRWLDFPEQNHGWVLVGDETGDDSARRFNTRENEEVGTNPELVITFDPPPCPPPLAASEVVRLGTPANPDAFRPGATSGPVIGATWDPYVDHATFHTTAVLDFVVISATPGNVPSSIGTILCGLTPPIVATGVVGANFALPIPDSCYQTGVQLCAQAGSVDASGGIELTNALDVTLGTF